MTIVSTKAPHPNPIEPQPDLMQELRNALTEVKEAISGSEC